MASPQREAAAGGGKGEAAAAAAAGKRRREAEGRDAFANPKGLELSEKQWERLNFKAERRRQRKRAKAASREASLASAEEEPPARAHRAEELLVEGEKMEFFELQGLRHVRPYSFPYTTHVKERWVGQPLAAVMAREFARYSLEYFQRAAERGTLLVDGRRPGAGAAHALRRGEKVTHVAHRHEAPVLARPAVEVVRETPHVVVVSKPATLPIHPCGGYRHNSLLYVLAHERGDRLFTINRIDRLTSGLVILAKSGRVAARYIEQLRAGSTRKKYLARVLGRFPDGEREVEQPIKKVDHQTGEHRVMEGGKPARSVFRRLSYDGRTSVVEAEPVTGRTHQLRLHLQWLGHPIANDPKYGGVLTEAGSYAVPPRDTLDKAARALVRYDEAHSDALCDECASGSYWGDAGARYSSGLWLHCLEYSGPDWSFAAPPPAWAADDFDSAAVLDAPATVAGRLVA